MSSHLKMVPAVTWYVSDTIAIAFGGMSSYDTGIACLLGIVCIVAWLY